MQNFKSKIKVVVALSIGSNVVTFFVKIAEMTMARLTNVYFPLVESQKSGENIGWTWSIWTSYWIYFDGRFCFFVTFGKIDDWIAWEVDLKIRIDLMKTILVKVSLNNKILNMSVRN